jgi:hypothetical protein
MSRWWVTASCISTGRMDQWDDEDEGIMTGGCSGRQGTER